MSLSLASTLASSIKPCVLQCRFPAPPRLVAARVGQDTKPEVKAAAPPVKASKAGKGEKPAKIPKAERPFSNKQIFIVPADRKAVFEAAWQERESIMRAFPGFEDFSMKQNGDEYTISSSWKTIPGWEALSLSKPYRRSHLPSGIYQRIPKTGEGFPEDFVPFLDMNTFVTARY